MKTYLCEQKIQNLGIGLAYWVQILNSRVRSTYPYINFQKLRKFPPGNQFSNKKVVANDLQEF